MNTIVFGIILLFLLDQKANAIHSVDVDTLYNRLLEVEETLRHQSKLLHQQDHRIQDLEKECDILRQDNEQLRKQQHEDTIQFRTVNERINVHDMEIERLKNQTCVERKHSVSRETRIGLDDNAIKSHVDVHLTGRSGMYDGKDRRILLPSTDQQSKIAFYGYMSRSEDNPSKHKTLVFDHVITNVGLGYNNNTGVFTMPLDGVYAFSYSVHVYCQEFTMVEIMKNSEVEGVIIADANGGCHHDFSTGNAVLSGSKGDVVYIAVHSTIVTQGLIRSDGYGRSSFSGWLVG